MFQICFPKQHYVPHFFLNPIIRNIKIFNILNIIEVQHAINVWLSFDIKSRSFRLVWYEILKNVE
jgi:hypothetical protein